MINRNGPNTDPAKPLTYIVPMQTKDEMINLIKGVMKEAWGRIGSEQYTEAERILQLACWDEWVNTTPGLVVTLNRLRSDEITIEQAAIDINSCIDLLNIIT